LEVNDRPLATAVEPHLVLGWIEDADESRDESVLRKRIGDLVVDLYECRFQICTETKSHPKHRMHLSDRKGGRDAMPGGIGEDSEQALVEHRKIERVSARQLGRLEHAVKIIALKQRHGRRKR